jgi:hypothetical protein
MRDDLDLMGSETQDGLGKRHLWNLSGFFIGTV